jgi:membrane protein DedA with SNARE-associated domain
MIADLVLIVEQQPLLVGLALFLATFLVEDGATIAAGVLVAETGVDPVAALTGVIMGTAAGDLALYGLGRRGKGTAIGQRLCARPAVARAEQWIRGRVLSMVFVARFLPGSRLPIFTASGLVEAPLWPVAAIVVVTTPIWTGTLFAVAWAAGQAGAERFLMIAVPVALILVASIQIVRAITRHPACQTFRSELER